MKYNLEDTICAIATGEGGAISLIRVSGTKAIEIADLICEGKSLMNSEGYKMHFGVIKKNNQILDEVIFGVFKGPRSFTGEDIVEISCHGSTYTKTEILNLLCEKGCRLAEPGEFTLRAFLNKKMDLSQAEAVADLVSAKNQSQQQLAMNQMRGGFKKEISALRQKLMDFASLLELELDFSEEDVEFADRKQLINLIHTILKVVNDLIESFEFGNVIKEGIHTVIVGRPNAGKSTLLNAILKEERAIVSDIEGTTRDTIEEILTVNGVDFRLIDTAGIREATNEIEVIGIGKTYDHVKKGALLIYVYDASKTSQNEVNHDLKKLRRDGLKEIVVANKSDLLDEAQIAQIPKDYLIISAQENETEKVISRLQAFLSIRKSENETVVYNSRHVNELTQVKESLDKVLSGFDMQIPSDLIAGDIRNALHHLGMITGEVTNDDLLGNIFSNFCIGK